MNPADALIYPDAPVLHQDRYVAAVPPYHNMPDGIVKSPRLKEVCDSCSAAKVRCSRDKDGCNRCIARGIECIYSASRRVGRRRGPRHRKRTASISSIINCPSSPSSAMDCTESDASPLTYLPMAGDVQDKAGLDSSYLWTLPPHPEDSNVQFPGDHGLYGGMQDYDFNQPFLFPLEATNTFSGTISPPETLTPIKTSKSSSMASEPKEYNSRSRDHSSTSISTQDSINSTRRSSPSSDMLPTDPTDPRIHTSHIESVYDELQGLNIFAFAMEQKFDAVVRQQKSCRPISSTADFGLPLEELLLKPDDGSGSGNGNGKGRNEPGQLESAYYYSLAELRRRLKWLREDVGNMITQPGKGAGATTTGSTAADYSG